MAHPSLASRIQEINVLLDQAIEATGRDLAAADDNPAIQRHSIRPRAFTVSSSELMRTQNWTPFFHDWKAQYAHLKELLSAKKFAAVRTLLDGKAHAGQRLAPEVIARAKPLIGELV